MDALTFDDLSKGDLEDIYWFLSEAKDDNHKHRDTCDRWKDEINSQYRNMNAHMGDRCTIVFKGGDYQFMVDAAILSYKNRGNNGRAGISGKIIDITGNRYV